MNTFYILIFFNNDGEMVVIYVYKFSFLYLENYQMSCAFERDILVFWQQRYNKSFFSQLCQVTRPLIHVVQGGGTVITEGGGIDHTNEMADDMMVTLY